MKVPKCVNVYRRRIMHFITKSVGSSQTDPEYNPENPIKIKNVLIIRPNHRLGNQLLLTPIVQEVANTFTDCSIDLFVKGGVANPVFENYSQINKIYELPKKPFSHLFKYVKCWVSIKNKHYDLVINGDKNSSSGRLLTQISKAEFKIFGETNEIIQKNHTDHEHIAKYPVYNLRYYLAKLGFKVKNIPAPCLNLFLDEDELLKGRQRLQDIIGNNKKTICIYTNATGDKCYSEDWWNTLYKRLKNEYEEEYNIIEMLPIENISKINFKAPHFYSKDIREMASIIKNTSIFIAADNGIMHLSSATLTPTIGFFSVTNQNIYGPYGNNSIALNTNETCIEDWIKAINKVLNKL